MTRFSKSAALAALAFVAVGLLGASLVQAQSEGVSEPVLSSEAFVTPGAEVAAGIDCGSTVCAPNEMCCPGCNGAIMCQHRGRACKLPACPPPFRLPPQIVGSDGAETATPEGGICTEDGAVLLTDGSEEVR